MRPPTSPPTTSPDLVVAYPTVDAHDIAAVCRQLARGAPICLIVDEPGQLAPLIAAAAEHQVEIAVAIDLDMFSTA